MRFGVFELDIRAGELRKQGVKLKLQDQPLKILQILLEHSGEIVSREELRARVWPANTFVEFDQGLYSAMARLRDALGDSAESPHFIETVARRGYRFIAPVTVPEKAAGPSSPRGQSPRRWRAFLASLVAGLLGGGILLLIVLGFNLMDIRGRLSRKRSPGIHALAVLPLENMSQDPDQEYFADGMTEALTTNLARISSLRVVSRTSAMQYKGVHKPLAQIARELGVDAVVEGSVVRSGQRVRISAQLIKADDDEHLWAEMYERDLDDVLHLQALVAQAIADQIRVHLTPEEKMKLAAAGDIDAESYELYLRGRFYWNKRDPEGLKKSKELFEQAIARNPNFALPYVGLADTYLVMLESFPIPSTEALSKSRAASLQALKLDDNLAEAHASLAFVHFLLDWDWASAETEFRRAIALNPGYATAHHWYSMYLSAMGRCDEAITEFRRAQQSDPLSMIIRIDGAADLYWCHQLDPAIEEVRRVLEMSPDYQKAHLYLAGMYAHKGLYQESMTAYRRSVELAGPDRNALLAQFEAWVQAMGGRRADAIKTTERVRKSAGKGYLDPYIFAQVYAALGDQEHGMQELEKAYRNRGHMMVYIKVDPKLDGLRSDPRFTLMLQRMKLG